MMAVRVKSRGGHDQDRSVNEQREHERRARVDRRELNRLSFSRRGLFILARLHDRGMQVKIVRHDGGAEKADGNVEHVAVAYVVGGGHKVAQHGPMARLRKYNYEKE